MCDRTYTHTSRQVHEGTVGHRTREAIQQRRRKKTKTSGGGGGATNNSSTALLCLAQPRQGVRDALLGTINAQLGLRFLRGAVRRHVPSRFERVRLLAGIDGMTARQLDLAIAATVFVPVSYTHLTLPTTPYV